MHPPRRPLRPIAALTPDTAAINFEGSRAMVYVIVIQAFGPKGKSRYKKDGEIPFDDGNR